MDVENDSQGLLARRNPVAGKAGPAAPMDVEIACATQELCVDRATAEYVNEDGPFRIAKRAYERQYAQLYFARLTLLSGALKTAARTHWPNVELVKILDVGNRPEGQQCCVVGTLYKDMKLKPSILDEYTSDRGMRAALNATSLCSDTDHLALEDEGGRMLLRGDPAHLPVLSLVTGVVVAVRGENQLGGDFVVHEVLYPGMPPQAPLPVLQSDCYVALMSGMKFSSTRADALQLQLALDMLLGYAGSDADQRRAAQVVRLVIAGGSIGGLDILAAAPTSSNQYGRQQQLSLQPVRDLDMLLTETCAALPVDLMPGPDDPANVALPQQPMHKCLLPGAVRSSGLVRATNPHAFSLAGVQVLGTSGQPSDDLALYSNHTDRASGLEACLQWRHLAPTAPDTLASYPFYDADPFILTACPHVLFAGNQPAFESRVVTGPAGQQVRVVVVPSFAKTGCVVLVNLRTLEPTPLYFKAVPT